MLMYLYKTILPQTAIGTKYDWAEHLAFGRTVVFDKVVFIDRSVRPPSLLEQAEPRLIQMN